MFENGTVVDAEKPVTINLDNISSLDIYYNLLFDLIDYQDFDFDLKDQNVQ